MCIINKPMIPFQLPLIKFVTTIRERWRYMWEDRIKAHCFWLIQTGQLGFEMAVPHLVQLLVVKQHFPNVQYMFQSQRKGGPIHLSGMDKTSDLHTSTEHVHVPFSWLQREPVVLKWNINRKWRGFHNELHYREHIKKEQTFICHTDHGHTNCTS